MDLAERLDRYIASKSRKPDPFASDTDAMRDQLTSGGMPEDQAFDLALAMARERERARDVPEENILGGDMSRLFQQDPTMMERIKRLPAQTLGAGEALASLGSAAALSVPSMVQSLVTGEKDPLGMMKRQMYVPKTEEGMGALTAVGELIPEIPAMPQVQLQALQAIPAGAAAAQAQRGLQSGLRAAQPMLAEGAERVLGAQGLMMQAAPSAVARMEAPTSPLGFYDPVHQAALNIQRKQGPGQAFLNELQRSENVNKEFLESSGIAEKLRNSPSITREQVQELAKGAVPEIQEVVKGGQPAWLSRLDELENLGEGKSREEQIEYDTLRKSYQKLMRETGGAGVPTKYERYQLPGGENYREVLLTMPKVKSSPQDDAARAVAEAQKAYEQDNSYENYKRLTEARNKANQIGADWGAPEFRSSHWEEPNVVAHIRMNDRTDADGKKVLFIEELQSDWAQEGRKKGFAPKDADAQLKAGEKRMAERGEQIRQLSSRMAALDDTQLDEFNRLATERQRLQDLQTEEMDWGNKLYDARREGIISAPFVTNTKEWLDLSLKNIIKRAVDEGYDRVAFINGTQSKDRYKMSNTVDNIEVAGRTNAKTGEKTKALYILMLDGKTVQLGVDANGVIDNVSGELPGGKILGKPLSDVVGKDLADNLMTAPSGSKIAGEGLDIGGKGMMKFYDEIVPERINTVLKRFGGGKTNVLTIPADRSGGRYIRYEIGPGTIADRAVIGITPDGNRIVVQQSGNIEKAVKELNEQIAGVQQIGFDITPAMRERFQKPIPYKKGGLVQAFQFGGTVKSIAAGAKAGAKGAAKAAKPTKAELAHRQAQINAAKPIEEGGLGLRPDNTAEERAAAQGYIDYYHGTERLDRLLEKPGLDPRRATSGPMPYGTTTRELASNYAMSKADTSRRAEDLGQVENYFQVSPKDLGLGFRSPLSVERLWNFLSPEQKQKIMSLAPRVGYENLDDFTGKFTVHPEGVNATLSPSQWDFIMKREAKGNPLTALRHMWYESGQLVNDPSRLAEIYRLAGVEAPISQTNAPWTTAQGVLLGKARVKNPLDTSNAEQLQSLIPKLEEAFKRDRSRTFPQGTDQWDKRSRFTPKQWIDELKKDVEGGKESYVWTSIPDKVTNELKRFGFDSIIDKSGKGGGAKEPVVIPFYPEQVRSRFAAFDPMEQQSPDLLKKKGGLSVLRKKHGN